MLINAFREIDFRPADVQKRVRIAVGQLARLSRIDDVIGNRGHAGRKLGLGPVRSKGLNQRHKYLSTIKIRPGRTTGISSPDCTFLEVLRAPSPNVADHQVSFDIGRTHLGRGDLGGKLMGNFSWKGQSDFEGAAQTTAAAFAEVRLSVTAVIRMDAPPLRKSCPAPIKSSWIRPAPVQEEP